MYILYSPFRTFCLLQQFIGSRLVLVVSYDFSCCATSCTFRPSIFKYIVMKRKDFIKTGILASVATTVSPLAASTPSPSTYDRLMDQVGFNHLPNTSRMSNNTVLHKAATRGKADHGWLQSHHSFSFANYYNPDRMNFGVLRVLNDDSVAPGRGFGTHPHDNMEIISIPLEGDLEHKDSIGNVATIHQGDVQVMSAGSGVKHSEYNSNKDAAVKFLQIWIFPNKKNVAPRYDQLPIRDLATQNDIYQILSPSSDDAGVWIHQNAWMHIADLNKDTCKSYHLNDPSRNGVYAFVLSGSVTIGTQALDPRDGYGIWSTDHVELRADTDTKVLLIEVPMTA